MDIYFKDKKLKAICESSETMVRKFGLPIGRKLQQRLFELSAAENLSVISHLPPPRLHQLEGTRKSEFAIDLDRRFRLVFEPYPKEEREKEIEKKNVNAILVLEVTNYHG